MALRLSVKPEADKIRREARLAALFPPEVGYPPILETGVTDGYEWSLSQEILGQCLGEIWPDLGWNERRDVLRQLWHRTRAVHTVDLTAATGLARRQAWFNATDADAAEATLSHLTQQGWFTPAQTAVLRQALNRFWQVLPLTPNVLNHGDLTLDNALWHEGQVVALLDFEYAMTAPVELDRSPPPPVKSFAPIERLHPQKLPPDHNEHPPNSPSVGRITGSLPMQSWRCSPRECLLPVPPSNRTARWPSK